MVVCCSPLWAGSCPPCCKYTLLWARRPAGSNTNTPAFHHVVRLTKKLGINLRWHGMYYWREQVASLLLTRKLLCGRFGCCGLCMWPPITALIVQPVPIADSIEAPRAAGRYSNSILWMQRGGKIYHYHSGVLERAEWQNFHSWPTVKQCTCGTPKQADAFGDVISLYLQVIHWPFFWGLGLSVRKKTKSKYRTLKLHAK